MDNTKRTSLFNTCPEIQPLLYGAGWQDTDMDKQWILIESAAGEMFPGHVHLSNLEKYIKLGITEAGGKGVVCRTTDICDGIIQGSYAMRLSLASREIMSYMAEIHAICGHFDGVVYLSSCDKSIPAHLISSVRLNIPSILFPGGVMQVSADDLTLEETPSLGDHTGQNKDEQKMLLQKICPCSGACPFLGTACTMQILAEVLGLCLPHTALIPTNTTITTRAAFKTGVAAARITEKGINPLDIITRESIKNAIIALHAVGGSTNAILHLIALAKEASIDISLNDFDTLGEEIPFILNVKPSGTYPSSLIWHAGGVPYLIHTLREFIHLDAFTCTGYTWRRNLNDLGNTFFESAKHRLKMMNIPVEKIIMSPTADQKVRGGITLVHGNIAPDGGIIKTSAIPDGQKVLTGEAVVFDSYEDAVTYVKGGNLNSGEAIVVRYEGPRGGGMPEIYYITHAITSNESLAHSCILVTDGRFSGASTGYCVGYVSPEAAIGGPIALVENGDLIRLDLTKKTIDVVGTDRKLRSFEEIYKTLQSRSKEKTYIPRTAYSKIEELYRKHAYPLSQGGGIR